MIRNPGQARSRTGCTPSSTRKTLAGRPNLQQFPLRALLVALIISAGACECDDGGSEPSGPSGPPGVPTVDPPPPEATNMKTIQVGGFTDNNTAVWVENNGGDAVQVSGPAFGVWQGNVVLEEGENSLEFHARNVAGQESSRTSVFMVLLDSIAPDAPVLTTDIGSCLAEDTVTLEGTGEDGTTLVIDGTDSGTVSGGTWSFEGMPTTEGVTYTVSLRDTAGNTSGDLTITLVKGVPTPTIDPVTTPTAELMQTLTGTKGAGTGVTLTPEGGSPMTIVPANGSTTWTYELTLTPGLNTFTIGGFDGDDNPSCDTVGPITILQTDVCPPVVDDSGFVSPTNNPTLVVPGDKCPDTSVWLRRDGQNRDEAPEVVPLDSSSVFSFVLTLEEGENVFYVFTRGIDDEEGPEDGPFTVVLDTVAPGTPVFTPPSGETEDNSVTITGDKENDAAICVRRNQEPTCQEVVPGGQGTSFNTTINLDPGENFICLAAVDELGNTSEEVCFTIISTSGALARIDQPLEGAVVTSSPLTVAVTALDGEGEASGISGVEICYADDCGDATNQPLNSSTWVRTLTPSGGSGTMDTIRATATTTGGLEAVDTIDVLFIDGGLLLSDTSTPSADSQRPRIAADGNGDLHVVWADDCSQLSGCTEAAGNLPFDIFHRRFSGGTWGPITLVSESPDDGDSRNPAITTDSDGNIHIAWQDSGDIDGSGEDFDIVHRMYDIGTASLGDVTVITVGSDSDDEDVDIDGGPGGIVHMAFERRSSDFAGDIDIYHIALDTSDGTTTAPLLVSDHAEDGVSRTPAVAADNDGNVAVVWQDDGDVDGSGDDADILLRTGDTGGLDPIVVVSDNALDGVSLLPDVDAEPDGTLHIVWQDTATVLGSGADSDVVHRTWDETNGLSFYAVVSSGDLGSEEATINIGNDGTVYVAWTEVDLIGPVVADLFYAEWFGVFTGPEALVTAFSGISEWPDLYWDADSGQLHAVWEDDTDIGGAGADQDVFYLAITP